MSLNNKYNNEDILIRAVIAGVLNILNNTISYDQVWDNREIETIDVPWFYNQSGDERYMQDFYTHYKDCFNPRYIDGNFDGVPRGILTYTGSAIDATRITSRYIQGQYNKIINGQLETYHSNLFNIPLNIDLECEMLIDTQITSLKIEQIIREEFFKTITFYVYYKGLRIPCQVGFPDDTIIEKPIQYSFDPDRKITLKFKLQVECYQPVFDKTTEQSIRNKIKGINFKLYDVNDSKSAKIVPISPEDNLSLSKNSTINIEWTWNREGAILNQVNIYIEDNITKEIILIENNIENNGYYDLKLPKNFTSFNQPIISYNAKVLKDPIIHILPSTSSPYIINENSFIIEDPGYFITNLPDTSINATLEYKYNNKFVSYNNLIFNIIDYKINENNPIIFDSSVYPEFEDLSIREINIIIEDVNDHSNIAKINGLKIV